jgi:hypothetical protein
MAWTNRTIWDLEILPRCHLIQEERGRQIAVPFFAVGGQ